MALTQDSKGHIFLHVSDPSGAVHSRNTGKAHQRCHKHAVSLAVASAAVKYVDWKTGDGGVVSDVCFDPPGDGVGFLGRGSEPLGNGIAQVLQDFPVSIGSEPVCEGKIRVFLPVDFINIIQA